MTAVKRSAAVTSRPSDTAPVSGRSVALDVFRGLAILAMMSDHLAIVAGGPDWVRFTVGRLALPMFFVLAGHLASRPRWRHAGIVVVGLLLPLVVPWIDSPNVLVLWGVGLVSLRVLLWLHLPPWLLAVIALTVAANGWALAPGGYEVTSLVGLMGVGAMLPRSVFAWAGSGPEWVGALGRHPVWWYVGHLLVLQGVVLLIVALGGGS